MSQAPTPQQREMMEEAASRIAQDNCELACCFIQKTAVEKAGPEMDKRLATVSQVVAWVIQSTLLHHKDV